MKAVYLLLMELLVEIWYNLLYLLYKIGGITIKKLHLKQKEWLEYQCKKRLLQISKQKKRKREEGKRKYSSLNTKENKYIAEAPEVFSLVDNTEKTVAYFNKIISEIEKRKFSELFYFDLSKVTYLTIDAVMYIIAILRNIKGKKIFKYRFSGNQPVNEEARRLLKESGFFQYVKSDETNIIPNSSKIQIISGNVADPDVAKLICDFVNNACKTKIRFTSALYETLIELMTNTIQHAYKSKKNMLVNQWYVFVEDNNDKIKFAFLDTGEGIPRTIYKKWSEKIPYMTNDSKLIHSALKGEFRTETRSKNRGKGLPKIAEDCMESKITNLQVYAGSGCCKIIDDNNNPYILQDVNSNIFGTLFCWEIDKTNIKKEYKV